MDINEVKDLLDKFDSSSLTEFDLKEGDFQLYMNKNAASKQESAEPAKETQPQTAITEIFVEAPEQQQQQKPAMGATVATEKKGEIVSSPIVGVVYLKPGPDQEPFKMVGDSVKKGEVLCIIEAMKLMNEIVSEYDGIIKEVLVQNEEVVEFNQPLFRIG